MQWCLCKNLADRLWKRTGMGKEGAHNMDWLAYKLRDYNTMVSLFHWSRTYPGGIANVIWSYEGCRCNYICNYFSPPNVMLSSLENNYSNEQVVWGEAFISCSLSFVHFVHLLKEMRCSSPVSSKKRNRSNKIYTHIPAEHLYILLMAVCCFFVVWLHRGTRNSNCYIQSVGGWWRRVGAWFWCWCKRKWQQVTSWQVPIDKR